MVAPGEFERQMRYLRRHFDVLDEDTFVRRLDSGDGFDSRSALVTFDDGYSDILARALPVLRAAGIPAVVFLNGRGGRVPELSWWHDLALIVEVTARPGRQSTEYWRRLAELGAVPAPERARLIEDDLRRHDLIDDLRRLRYLDRDDAWALLRSGLALGGHTLHHENLGTLDEDAARSEIVKCQALVSRWGARTARGFAFPFGKREHCPDRITELLPGWGVTYAVTTEWGINAGRPDPLRLRRIVIDGTDSLPAFICKVEGILRS
jgi:peptidoglycan/xylan/chitin deacetylase (PgdA/CDA1 family)